MLYEAAFVWLPDSQRSFDGIAGFFVEYAGILVVPFAVALALGYRTRLATFLTWVIYTIPIREQLLASEGRVFLGNYILALMLFWGLFLPLGKTWSLDARVRPDARYSRFLSVASAGILLQVFLIYFSAGITRDMGEWVFDATALQTILGETRFGSDLGASLTQYPALLSAMSIFTIALELIGTVLLFYPGKSLAKRRVVVLSLYIAFHAGMFFFMDIGIFPFVMITVWLLFMPSSVWDRITGSGTGPPLVVDSSRVRAVGASLVLGFIAISNVITWLYFPDLEGWQASYQLVGRYLLLYQQWAMFAVPSSLV